ncbi:hypothetical protein GNI_189270, partial [Gregarina niphandrodes]
MEEDYHSTDGGDAPAPRPETTTITIAPQPLPERKRRITQVTPPTLGELAVVVYDLKEEIARLRQDVRAERKRGETETAMLNDMVEAYTGMTTLTKEHHKKQTAQITKMMNEISDRQTEQINKMMNEISNKLLTATQRYPSHDETTKPTTKAKTSRPRATDSSHGPDRDMSEATTTRRG